MEKSKYENDIAISSRVRIARNLKKYPFPSAANEETFKKIKDEILLALNNKSQAFYKSLSFIEMEKLTENQKLFLVEKHIISPELGKNPSSCALIDKDNTLSIMINEEDHLRIQAFKEGFDLKEAYTLANKVDDLLQEGLEFAYSTKYGYLTSCPTNLGSALRFSVMLHLPATILSNKVKPLINTIGKYGLTIRGIYGESSKALGDLFQLSNQNSLGLSEEEILDNLHTVAKEIIKDERESRLKLLKENSIALEDRISRAYGILTNCKTISTKESMQLLSLIRLGVDLELIKEISPKTINDLFNGIGKASLAYYKGRQLENEEIDVVRSSYIKEKLNS